MKARVVLSRKGLGYTAAGVRFTACRLRESMPGGYRRGDILSVNMDAPVSVDDRVLVEYRGGLFVRPVLRSDVAMAIEIDGRQWPIRRASWGVDCPVVIGRVHASGRPL